MLRRCVWRCMQSGEAGAMGTGKPQRQHGSQRRRRRQLAANSGAAATAPKWFNGVGMPRQAAAAAQGPCKRGNGEPT